MEKDFYSKLSEKYGIPTRFWNLLKQLQDVIVGCGLENYVQVNEDVLGKAVFDYFEDVDRLKDFQEIEHISVSKIYAYEAYWLMKRKPIHVIDTSCQDERCIYINEIACSVLLLSKMSREKGVVFEKDDPKVKYFFNLLYYNMKYREFTPKSLELVIEAFFLGCQCR